MKKVLHLLTYILISTILLVNLISCRSKPQYYIMEDFDFVVIGETTMNDIFDVVQNDVIATASYGASQTFPMQDGRFIKIKYMGPDMVVFSIEIVDRKTGDNSVS